MATQPTAGSTFLTIEPGSSQTTHVTIKGSSDLPDESDADSELEIDDVDPTSVTDGEEDTVDNVLDQIFKAASQGNTKEITNLIFKKETQEEKSKVTDNQTKKERKASQARKLKVAKKLLDTKDINQSIKRTNLKRKGEIVKVGNSKVLKSSPDKCSELSTGDGSVEGNKQKENAGSEKVLASAVSVNIPVTDTQKSPLVSPVKLPAKKAEEKSSKPLSKSIHSKSKTATISTKKLPVKTLPAIQAALPRVPSVSSLPTGPLLIPVGAPGTSINSTVAAVPGSLSNTFVLPGSSSGICTSSDLTGKKIPLLLVPASPQQLFYIDKTNPGKVFTVTSSSLPTGPTPSIAPTPNTTNPVLYPVVQQEAAKAQPTRIRSKKKAKAANKAIQKPVPNKTGRQRVFDFTPLTRSLERTLRSSVATGASDVKVVVFCNNKPVQSFSVTDKHPYVGNKGSENTSVEGDSNKWPESAEVSNSKTLAVAEQKTTAEIAGEEIKDAEVKSDEAEEHENKDKVVKEEVVEGFDADPVLSPNQITETSSAVTDVSESDVKLEGAEVGEDKEVINKPNEDKVDEVVGSSTYTNQVGQKWKVKLVVKKQEKKKGFNNIDSPAKESSAQREISTPHSEEESLDRFSKVVIKTEVEDPEYNESGEVTDECLSEKRLVISEPDCEEPQEEKQNKQQNSETAIEFTCFICGRSFAKSRYLRKHIQRVHENPKTKPTYVKANWKIAPKTKKTINTADKPSQEEEVEGVEENNIRETDKVKASCSVDISVVKQEPVSDSEGTDPFLQTLINTPSTSTAETVDPLTTSRLSRIRVDIDEIDNFQFLKSDLPKTEDGKIEPVYVCEQCGKFYRSRKALKEHFIREHNPAPGEEPLYIYIAGNKYQCNICFNYFHSASELLSHSKTHTGELQSECIICGKIYASVHVLRRHIENLHADIRPRPFQCNLCDYAASNKWHLKEHYRRHTGEQPFQCPVCQKTFSHQGTMNRHCKIKHNIDCTRTSSKNIFSPNNSLLLGPGYMPEMSSIEKIIANMGTEHVIESEKVNSNLSTEPEVVKTS